MTRRVPTPLRLVDRTIARLARHLRLHPDVQLRRQLAGLRQWRRGFEAARKVGL